jgi:hypothetical protein
MYAFGQQLEKLLLQSMAKKNNVTFSLGFRYYLVQKQILLALGQT